jgi:hypothetical protein
MMLWNMRVWMAGNQLRFEKNKGGEFYRDWVFNYYNLEPFTRRTYQDLKAQSKSLTNFEH